MPVLGAGCGLRQGEIFGLALEAIDFLRQVVHVRQQLRLVQNQVVLAPPKGGRERGVPLPDVVAMSVAGHVQRFGTAAVELPWREPGGEMRSVELMFTNRDRGPLTRAYFTHNAWKPALQRPGWGETGRTECTPSDTTTPRCSSRTGSASEQCPNTWAITIQASPCAPTPT